MVQIIQQRDKRPSFLSSLVAGAGQAIPEAVEKYQENRAIKKNLGIDLAGISDQQTRQAFIADQLRYGRQRKQAESSQNVSLIPGEQENIENVQNREDRRKFIEENRSQKKEEFPEFLGMKEKQKSKAFGHVPQTETTGVKRQLMTPEQIISEGQRIAQEYTKNGIPTDVQQGISVANSINDMNRQHNAQVDADIQQQVASQQSYGNLAVEKLKNVVEEPTGEEQALFRRKGEEISRNPKFNTSEAAIQKELSKEARIFKNRLSDIKKSIPAPRLFQKIKEKTIGPERAAESRKKDIQIKLKPLLDEGLYNTSRNLLSEIGYNVEEREDIISSLGEPSKKILANFPKMKRSDIDVKRGYQGMPLSEGEFTPADKEKITTSIKDSILNEPSVNLILLRKAFEGKGVDWSTFKDTINDLILDGEIQLNEDQLDYQLSYLDTPAFGGLDSILHGLNLI
jgi:hypothetical protein